LGHERRHEWRYVKTSGILKYKNEQGGIGIWATGGSEREWDMENFSNDYMDEIGYI